MKYNNLAFVIGLAGSALAAPFSPNHSTPDGKSESLTPPVDSSSKDTCSTNPHVNKNTCRSLVDRFIADMNGMQHQGMPHRRDIHFAADDKTPILTYSANAGDRRFVRLSRRGPETEGQKKEDSANTPPPLQIPGWPTTPDEWSDLAKEWPELSKDLSSLKNNPSLNDDIFAPSLDSSGRGEAPAAEMDGCTLEISKSLVPKNANDELPESQNDPVNSLFNIKGLGDQVKSATSSLLQNCDIGVIHLDNGVTVSIAPPAPVFPTQLGFGFPDFGFFGPYGNPPYPPTPMGHGNGAHGQPGSQPYPPTPMGLGNGAYGQPSNLPYPPMPMHHDNDAHEQPSAEQTGDHSPYPPPAASREQESAEQVGGLPYPPMPMAHEPESAQPPTPAHSGPSPVEEQTPEAAHEDVTPPLEAAHEDVTPPLEAAHEDVTPPLEAAHEGVTPPLEAAHEDVTPPLEAAQEDVTPKATPEAAHEDIAPKAGHEAGNEAALDADDDTDEDDAGYDDTAHADAKLGEDVADDKDAAAESYASPETPAAGAGIPEKMQAGHNAAPEDVKPAAQPLQVAR